MPSFRDLLIFSSSLALWMLPARDGATAAETIPCSPFSSMVVFGDSHSETGNYYLGGGTDFNGYRPPYYQFRPSNGPLWVERLADHLGLPDPAPSLANGDNYAYSHAETGPGLGFGNTPNIDEQIEAYLENHRPDPGTLIVLWGGINDAVFTGKTMSTVVSNVSREITTLAGAGGKSFLILNLPRVGESPLVRPQTGWRNAANARAVQFNLLLPSALDQLEATLGIEIFRLDVFALTEQIRSHPAAFGLSNLTDPALVTDASGGYTIAAMPDQYFYWDITHMTTAVHGYIGDAAAQLVLPETLASFSTSSPGATAIPSSRSPAA